MSSAYIDGGNPLIGTVDLSGSKLSALKLIYAAMFCNEDVILENVPKIGFIEEELEVIRSVGGTAQWSGKNTLILNGSTINSYKIPAKAGSKIRTAFLLSAPLLYRFGKAFIPKLKDTSFKPSPVNRFLDVWDSLGVICAEDDDHYMLSNENLAPATINFRTPTNMGTDLALLMSLFISGETIINNASEELDTSELVDFLQEIGGEIVRLDPKRIKVVGKNIFHGASWTVSSDKTEAVTFAVAALLTNGNILIKGVDRESLTSFLHLLMKMGARFEFNNDVLKVWRSGEDLQPATATISPFPGLIADWQSLITLLLCKATGESFVYDTIYYDRFDYIKDLNRMGAKVDLVKPSEIGKSAIISDDSYNIEKMGEPENIIKIQGPAKIKSERLDITDLRYGAVLVLAALAAEGKSEIFNAENIEYGFEHFFDKLSDLGAKIQYVTNK